MAAGSTYTPIATQTLGSSQSTVSFTSIPSTYTDLVLVCGSITGASANTLYMELNADTATNYSGTFLYGDGTSAVSGRGSNLKGIFIGALLGISSTVIQNCITHIQNYSNTTTYKSTLSRWNNSASATEATVGLWRSTSAVNRIDIYIGTGSSGTPTGNIAAGSTFTLYGISCA
jgi:hypothetical protein